MAIGSAIERMDDRMDVVEAALRATFEPGRVVKRSYFRHYTAHTEDEITKGVLMLVSAGERNYSQALGMAAREGTHRMLIIGHVKQTELDEPRATEDAELDLIEAVKAWVRSGLAGMELTIDRAEHSRQTAHPFGWVVIYLDAGPPRRTTV